MDEDTAKIRLGRYRGSLDRFLAALEAARLDGAVLQLDGDCADLNELVDQRTADRPELAEANRRRREGKFNFLGGRIVLGGARHLELPIVGDNLAAVRAARPTCRP